MPDDNGFPLLVSDELGMMLNNWHHENPGEPLTLTAAQVAELAGCADPQCLAGVTRA